MRIINEFKRNLGDDAFELLYRVYHNLNDDLSCNIYNHTGQNNIKYDGNFHDISSVKELKRPGSQFEKTGLYVRSILRSFSTSLIL